MKRLILALAVVSIASTAAARGNGPAGCGLGTAVVFKNPSAWWQHVLAATTNQTSGNQTFGMTSGTLGCQRARGPLAGVQSFMDDNLGQLAVETAQGQGETLEALSSLIGVEAADKTYFNQTLKANFNKVFSAEATSGDAHQALTEVLAQDQKLQKYLG
jgi:hypothetical protein